MWKPVVIDPLWSDFESLRTLTLLGCDLLLQIPMSLFLPRQELKSTQRIQPFSILIFRQYLLIISLCWSYLWVLSHLTLSHHITPWHSQTHTSLRLPADVCTLEGTLWETLTDTLRDNLRTLSLKMLANRFPIFFLLCLCRLVSTLLVSCVCTVCVHHCANTYVWILFVTGWASYNRLCRIVLWEPC